MRNQRLLIRPLVLVALALAVLLAVAVDLVYFTLDAPGRAQFARLLGPRAALLVLAWALGVVAAMAALQRWWVPRVSALPELAEQTRALVNASAPLQLKARAQADQQPLADAVNALAAQRDALRADVAAEVARASASVRLERNRLAALMSELTQSVVVCNLDGRVLLYNNRARTQFRALSDAPGVAGGGELIGLGRSIYGVFERNLIAHALDTIQQRLRRGVAQPQANFVTTTRAGQLLRVQMAPVLSVAAVAEKAAAGEGEAAEVASAAAPERTVTGFILMLDNITRNFETESRRDQLLHNLTEGNRASLANVRAAADMLEFEDLTDDMRTRFRKVVRDEVQAMSQRLDHTANEFADSLKARWQLEEMLGADLIAAVQRRIEARIGLPTKLEEVDESLWLKVDSFSLMQAITYLGSRLSDEF